MKEDSFSSASHAATFLGAVIGTTVATALSGIGLLRAMDHTEVTSFDYVVVVMCIILCFRFYFRVKFGSRNPDLRAVLSHLVLNERRVVFGTYFALVCLSCLNVAVLRQFGVDAAIIVFWMQALALLVGWMLVFRPLFFLPSVELERSRQFWGRHLTTFVIDFMLPSALIAIVAFDRQGDQFEAAAGAGLAMFGLLMLVEFAFNFRRIADPLRDAKRAVR